MAVITHVEQVLATAISRTRILLSFVSLGVVVGLLSLVLSGLGLWLAANGVMDEPIVGFGLLPLL